MTRYPTNNRPVRRGKVSAGLLMYRISGGQLEVFLARPGGPWFPHRQQDIWTIPKGEVESGEELLGAAVREFHEEVGLDAHSASRLPPRPLRGYAIRDGGRRRCATGKVRYGLVYVNGLKGMTRARVTPCSTCGLT